MGGFPLLDVVIGLCFIYLLLALICSTLTEWAAQYRSSRGRMLGHAVRALLGEANVEPRLTKRVLAHPLISGLSNEEEPPSYINSRVFAKALSNALAAQSWKPASGAPGAASSPEPAFAAAADDPPALPPALSQALTALAESGTSQARMSFTDSTKQSLPTEDAIATWYDSAMDRVSGTYRRQARKATIVVAALVTIVLNVDTIELANTLWRDSAVRGYLVERAKVRLEQGPPLETVEYTEPDSSAVTPPDTAGATARSASSNTLLDEETALLGSLFGWKIGLVDWAQRGVAAIIWSLIGWTITALAVSLGAPFWFDTLNRFMSVRSAGKVPPRAISDAPDMKGTAAAKP